MKPNSKKRNPFQDIELEKEPPKHMKEKVMKQVHLSQMLLDSADLFTTKFGKTIRDFTNQKK